MKPEKASRHLLSLTQAKAKMYEYGVPLEDHILVGERPKELFMLVVGLLGDAAAAIAAGKPDDPRRATSPESLQFAARYFYSFIEARLNEQLTPEFCLLAAAAFYLSDNPGSARVLSRLSEAPSNLDDGGLAYLAHNLLCDQYDIIYKGPYADDANKLVTDIASYFNVDGESDEVLAAASAIRTRAYDAGTARELLYADIVAAVVHCKVSRAARAIVPMASGLDLSVWRDSLKKATFPKELWPAQRRICSAGLLSGRSSVIQMPTSAGKTKASEILLRSAFLSGRTSLAVIVAPFRSLCHDIRGDLARAFSGEEVVINEATEAFVADVTVQQLSVGRTILIVTPEKLLYILKRTPDLAKAIGIIIYDEGHLFDSERRGATYELLLASLKLTIPKNTQVVLISAVIPNASSVAYWLLGNEEAVVSGDGLAPTAKITAFTSWVRARGHLKYMTPDDAVQDGFFVPRVIQQEHYSTGDKEWSFPTLNGTEIGLYLALRLAGKGSVAVFCGKKATAAKLCAKAVEVFEAQKASGKYKECLPLLMSDAGEIEKLTLLVERQLGDEAAATRAAGLGVLAHHANTPHGIRLAIEYAMKEGKARVVVCTSTLAQGVNLPIKYLIVTGSQQGTDRILVRDFQNLIGRAGRSGMHVEGSVIFSDPKIFDSQPVWKERWKWEAVQSLLNPKMAEPCSSTIAALFEPFVYGKPRRTISLEVHELCKFIYEADSFVNELVDVKMVRGDKDEKREFRRYLRSCASVVQAVASYLISHLNFGEGEWREGISTLLDHTLAYSISNEDIRGRLAALFMGIADIVNDHVLLDGSDSALRKSLISPAHLVIIRDWLVGKMKELSEISSQDQLIDLVLTKIIDMEISPKISSLSDPYVMVSIAKGWIQGKAFSELLDVFVASDVRIGGNRWKLKIDDVVGLCEGGIGYEAAIVVATMADLMEDVAPEIFERLSLLQRQMKSGLQSREALAFFEAGFADRIVATTLATHFSQYQERGAVRRFVRREKESVASIIEQFPSYFLSVCDEMAAG